MHVMEALLADLNWLSGALNSRYYLLQSLTDCMLMLSTKHIGSGIEATHRLQNQNKESDYLRRKEKESRL